MARNVEFNEEQAIDKAMEVFWKNGYTATSMRDLTDAMKINSSSLYNTIGDKHTLFIKCLEQYTAQRQQRFLELVQGDSSPLERLKYLINVVAESIDQTPAACMAIKASFELAEQDTAVHSILKKDLNFSFEQVKMLLEQACIVGEVDADMDIDATAHYVVNSFTGWYEMYVLYKNKDLIRNMSSFLIKTLL
ncbi:TetR family transcriptional regulator [Chryseobacterium aquifrigidense]|uniref:TetR family transcriptional regulator n=2 Tax=Chryseobacterium aquifrigidense TaxID=558021 RepID=A0A543EHN4_9FLAO|nr:TetR family transcriptional regulator [Chryseobacterium aquifrigidense]